MSVVPIDFQDGVNDFDIGGFRTILGDTNNNGEMNKCSWTNKAS